MKLCDPKHPDHYVYYGGGFSGWGGYVGDMLTEQPCDFFNSTLIFRGVDTHWWFKTPDGEFHGPFPYACCKNHQKQLEILRVCQCPDSEQTQPFPVRGGDRFSNAFKLALKARVKQKGNSNS